MAVAGEPYAIMWYYQTQYDMLYYKRPNNALHRTPAAAVSGAWHYAVQAAVAGELWR